MRKKSVSGFTLVECLLAGVVLAIFGAALAASVSQAVAANARAENERLAAVYLDELLTRIDVVGPAAVSSGGPLEGSMGEQFSWSAEIEQHPATDLYQVTVTIQWRTPRGTQSVRGYTLLHDAIGSRPLGLSWEVLDG